MITAASNSRLKKLIRLNQKAKARREEDVFLAEGVKMFLEAPAEKIREVYIAESFAPDGPCREKLLQTGCEVVADSLFSRISDTCTPQGILCVVEQFHYNIEELLSSAGLEAAANALRANQCDAAVVVAVQPPILMPGLLGEAVLTPFTTAHELSPFTDGTCGTLPGEGGAAFVLRRGSDARDDGSRCYARLHGCGMVSGLPSTEDGLRESLRRALHRALRRMPNGFRDIDYWEMNASGIPEEDAAEEALLNAATANRGAHIPLLAVGSAKTAFGNTFTAAGALGLLKGLLALNHCILPPSVTPVDDTFRLKLPERAYYWVQEARPWIASSARPRRLAVSTVSRKGRAGAAILEAMPDE